MDFSEKWGTDIDEAVKLALEDLNLTIDDVDVTVLEEPSRGFLGIGAKLAKVRVEAKKKEEEVVQEEPEFIEEPVREEKKAVKKESKPKKHRDNKKEKVKKTIEEPKARISDVPDDLKPVEEHPAIDFLKDVTGKMNLDLDITARANDESLYVDIKGKDSGTIIGKRGQTLDAIQYLTSLVVNKEKGSYVRVIVDAENYRAKRERTLEQLANRLGNKVARTGKMVRLEPMNPYERKVIHATLQKNPSVTTRSEGDEPYRKVVIEAKKQ